LVHGPNSLNATSIRPGRITDRTRKLARDLRNGHLVEKRGDYAEGRVPEYWIVNPQDETITVLSLSGDSYSEAGTIRRGETALSVLLPGFSVAVAAVFDAR
jgi:Uma2 family endonuclease